MTNRCRATPNTSPDSPSEGESGEVFGVALHLFVTKFLGSWVMNQPWRFCGVICVQKVGAFWRQMHSEGMCIWYFMQQRDNCPLSTDKFGLIFQSRNGPNYDLLSRHEQLSQYSKLKCIFFLASLPNHCRILLARSAQQ